MSNGISGDQREIRYHNKQIEFSRRWYQAHARRAEADLDYEPDRPGWQQEPSVGGRRTLAYRFLEFSTGRRLPASPAERDARFAELVAELDDDADRFERVASWWDEKKPAFLDPVLVDRCDYGFHNPDGVRREVRKSNADALVAIADYLGPALVAEVSRAAGRPLKTWKLPVYWVPTTKAPRPDLWVDWRVEGDRLWEIGLRLWISHKGAGIGVMAGWLGRGWKAEAEEVIRSTQLDGFRRIQRGDDDMGFFGRMGSYLYGRSYEPHELDGLDLRAETTRVAADAQPLLDALVRRAEGWSPSDPPPPGQSRDWLSDAVAEFRQARPYPTDDDEKQKAYQPRLREMLLPGTLATTDRAELRKIWTQAYGHPGPMSHLHRSLTNADEVEYERILETLEYVCWGDEDDADRIDKVLGDPYYKVRGLGESATLKLLAVCHPERYLCVYPYSGESGKLQMLKVLELDEPSTKDSRGRKHVESNDRLWQALEPLFPGDPWGMMCFLYWYLDRERYRFREGDPLELAATDLLVESAFLVDIVELLEDKGQVILYGPPGTGKTYLAQRLAEALAPKLWRSGTGAVPSLYFLRGLFRGLPT